LPLSRLERIVSSWQVVPEGKRPTRLSIAGYRLVPCMLLPALNIRSEAFRVQGPFLRPTSSSFCRSRVDLPLEVRRLSGCGSSERPTALNFSPVPLDAGFNSKTRIVLTDYSMRLILGTPAQSRWPTRPEGLVRPWRKKMWR